MELFIIKISYVDADGVKGYAPANFLQPMG
jgi:hypothetical protein